MEMGKTILFRKFDKSSEQELKIASNYFRVSELRSNVGSNQLVIARYSALPYYNELEEDLHNCGSILINSYKQHRYVADLGNWIEDLVDLTPQTWSRLEDVPDDGPFIVKGETNSKKSSWLTNCFAVDKRHAVDIACLLMDDSVISTQHIYIRKYIPLVKLIDGLNGMPVTEEYRFFVCDGNIISSGYYWSNYSEDLNSIPNPNSVPQEFLQKVINRIKDKIRFVVIDVAKTQSGDWIVIELNDAQMSGLSDNSPDILYYNLSKTLI